MSPHTIHIMTFISLCNRLHLDHNDVALHMKSIFCLFKRLIDFPELECCRDKLEGLLEEAKCQVIE